MALKNLYYRRLVSESGAKACWICFKPTSTVLITAEQDDWFHICPGHLQDRNLAIAQDEKDVEEKKRKEELDKEIEAVIKEYAKKAQEKAERRKKKKKGDQKKEEKKDDKSEEKLEDEKDEKEKEEKLKELEKKKASAKAAVEGPRIFELNKNFFQMRLQKRRDVEIAKRNRERLKNPTLFPSVPSTDLS